MFKILVVVALLIAGPAYATQCIYYDSQIRLTGKLSSNTHPRPLFKNGVREGEILEIVWFLELDSPLCVTPRPEDKGNVNLPVVETDKLRLLVTGQQFDRNAGLMGQKVTIFGRLVKAQKEYGFTGTLDVIQFIR